MVTTVQTLRDQIWAVLETIEDPELPVAITDLGLIGEVVTEGSRVRVMIVPTFSACPAIGVLREDIRARVGAIPGVETVDVEVSFAEPWTMARMSARGREQLFSHGISVPGPLRDSGGGEVAASSTAPGSAARPQTRAAAAAAAHSPGGGPDLTASGVSRPAAIQCPFCGSTNTRLENPFGPTLCRAIYYCLDCRNPIERFRPPGEVLE